jgi:deoxycytidylate deaminase
MKVGACALGYNNEVLGVAYNGLAPGKEVTEEFWVDRDKRRPFMIHAETNLLARIKPGQAKTLAITLQPCSHCAQDIVAYGIKCFVYSMRYDFDKGGLGILSQQEKKVILNFYVSNKLIEKATIVKASNFYVSIY